MKKNINPHIAHLKKIVPTGSTVYTKVLNVSASGMSREVMMLVTYKKEIINISYYVADSLGAKLGKDGGVIVKGTGMDMAYFLVCDITSITGNKNLTKRSI